MLVPEQPWVRQQVLTRVSLLVSSAVMEERVEGCMGAAQPDGWCLLHRNDHKQTNIAGKPHDIQSVQRKCRANVYILTLKSEFLTSFGK